MVEKKGLGKAIGHAFLWFGIAIVLFPLYIALVATTHTFDVLIGSTPLWFGGEFLKNFTTVLTQGLKAAGGIPVWVMMANSPSWPSASPSGKSPFPSRRPTPSSISVSPAASCASCSSSSR
ncbi:MAG: hypothetical protein ACLR0N_00045 [Bilophila wadsworthia]